MSHSSRIFDRVPIDLPNRSGFDLSHENLFTATCGTLTPVLCHPLLPNDTVSLGCNFQCQLPPMVTDFYGKVDAVVEVFFVPNRLLWGGWEDFITHPTKNPVYPEGADPRVRPNRVPSITFANLTSSSLVEKYLGAGSLADYLGLKTGAVVTPSQQMVSMMPFLAYHRIYDDWYRDTRIQAPVFYPPSSLGNPNTAPFVPYVGVTSADQKNGPSLVISSVLGDGVELGSLRQRNWSKGYFTTATPLPQAGGDSEIDITVDTDTGTGAISIAAIRAANSLAKWMERNNFSYRYADQIYGQFGIYPDAAKMDRAIFLGRTRQTVYSRSVFQTAGGADDSVTDVVAAKKGSSQAIGESSLVDSFRASEHGYLMAIFSLVPHSYYGTGNSREFNRLESEDFPFPLLAGMGDQAIKVSELVGFTGQNADSDTIFGYTDLYAEYKYMEDEVHGRLRDGQGLSNFALKRSFDSADPPQLGSQFLQIPTTALDEVQAVSTSAQGFSCWVDMFFPMKKVSTLPAYSLPTLADLKDVHTGYMSRSGTRL